MSSVRTRKLDDQLKEHLDALDFMKYVWEADKHRVRHLAIQAQAAEGEAAEALWASHAELEESIRQRLALLRREVRYFPSIGPHRRAQFGEANHWKAP
jgi:hypothetical protein